MKPIIIIPARMASTRLPGKPMADIAGKPMIVQVADRARESDCGDVLIATDSREVLQAASDYGYKAVITSEKHQSGSDRIFEALTNLGGDFDVIINVQGDLPTISKADIRAVLAPLNDEQCDIATLGVEITDTHEKTNPNVVKIVGSPIGESLLRALYFTRATAPYGDGPLYHHIGLYAYRRAALERFVSLKPSTLEKRESLEQLRALEDGMMIHAAIIDTVPLGIDTPPDLERARAILTQEIRK
ncbi:3-deoxy-manno-octulosonate cytidylyltransferase [Ahrensia marina]|uniref:3-deoxy-manno-octulosonate cytidylyltransferase n=1 Tax=Ahrensia marina TaxID=1514904 RepID=A0A0N0VLF6_9HYPH|nr:3-deoxy-manno-octulosonate cytidylyltransferase [Ahrensia marina]KPB00538.1 3-deoxy-manno-octulosonate cytidylyltransferase [Ahrensia marina]